jgi:hypothetical protein
VPSRKIDPRVAAPFPVTLIVSVFVRVAIPHGLALALDSTTRAPSLCRMDIPVEKPVPGVTVTFAVCVAAV